MARRVQTERFVSQLPKVRDIIRPYFYASYFRTLIR